jgi:hypothetical protein
MTEISPKTSRSINGLKCFRRHKKKKDGALALSFVESGDDGKEKDRRQTPGIVRIQRF